NGPRSETPPGRGRQTVAMAAGPAATCTGPVGGVDREVGPRITAPDAIEASCALEYESEPSMAARPVKVNLSARALTLPPTGPSSVRFVEAAWTLRTIAPVSVTLVPATTASRPMRAFAVVVTSLPAAKRSPPILPS